MPLLDLTGLALSLLAVIAFVFFLRDWWRRRKQFQPLEHGTLHIDGRTMGVAWLLVLVLSFVAGVQGPLVLKTEASTQGPAHALDDAFSGLADGRATVQQTTTIQAPLPFYRWSRTEVRMGGRLQLTTTTRTLQVPLWFLAGILLYVQFVMRGRVTAREAAGTA